MSNNLKNLMGMYEARQNKEKGSRIIIQFEGHKSSSNLQNTISRKIISNRIKSVIIGVVAKAPIRMSDNIRKNAVYCVSRINQNTHFGTRGGETSTNTRVDIQGLSFNNTCYNVQLQVNNNSTAQLDYSDNTPEREKGTSLAEVHILKEIATSEQQDVKNRGLHLLRSCLLKSLNDRKSYKIDV